MEERREVKDAPVTQQTRKLKRFLSQNEQIALEKEMITGSLQSFEHCRNVILSKGHTRRNLNRDLYKLCILYCMCSVQSIL